MPSLRGWISREVPSVSIKVRHIPHPSDVIHQHINALSLKKHLID